MKIRCMGCMREKDSADPCPYCGFNLKTYTSFPHHLPPETILNGKFLIGKALGEGGFGITYIGWDLNLEIKVAIKEYFPNGLVTREHTFSSSLTVPSGKKAEEYQKGRAAFVDEARRLARFQDLPGIVSVRDYFLENNTAYIVMEYAEGQTLKAILNQQPGNRLSADVIFPMMEPVLNSLGLIHREGLIHRDISPDNLMIDPNGGVKLLDFGSARTYTTAEEKSLSIVLKPGYSPEEQYRSHGEQGPWTDIYALCATIYKAITGVKPLDALDRRISDTLKRPSELGIPISPIQEAALMKGLEVSGKDRWQNIGDLHNALYQVPNPDTQINTSTENDKASKASPEPVIGKPISKLWAGIILFAFSGFVFAVFLFSRNGILKKQPTSESISSNAKTDLATETVMEIQTESGTEAFPADAVNLNNPENATISDSEFLTVSEILGSDASAEDIMELLNQKVSDAIIQASSASENALLAKDYAETAKEAAESAEKKAIAVISTDAGTISYDNGDHYTGETEGDIREGYGAYYSVDGESYVGQWSDNQRNGFGICYYANGDVYSGYWKNDLLSDYGVYEYEAGGYYAGIWTDDVRNVYGVRYYSDGSSYEGMWLNNERIGYGIRYYTDGGYYKGMWQSDARNGYGIRKYDDDSDYVGEWLEGVRNGYGIRYYTDGTSLLGIWQEDSYMGEYSS